MAHGQKNKIYRSKVIQVKITSERQKPVKLLQLSLFLKIYCLETVVQVIMKLYTWYTFKFKTKGDNFTSNQSRVIFNNHMSQCDHMKDIVNLMKKISRFLNIFPNIYVCKICEPWGGANFNPRAMIWKKIFQCFT